VKPYVTKNKITANSAAPHALYHLDDDPREAIDLAAKHPERVKSMRDALEAWCRDVEHDRTRDIKP
jgi:hypothetical protein